MRAAPNTLEILESYALREPRRPALREDKTSLDVSQLVALASNCAAALHELGVRPGHKVAVAGPGFMLQVIVLLGAEALGAVTASFLAEGDPDAQHLFTLVDWVVAGKPQEVPRTARFVLLDDAFQRSLSRPVQYSERRHWRALEAHEPQRISRTSGSTGRSKFMLLSRQAQEYWISGSAGRIYAPDARLLVCGPFVINAAYTRTTRCLRNGGMVMAGHGSQLPDLAPTNVWGLPLHLERLLSEAPPDYVSPIPVDVSSVGGLLSAAMRARIAQVWHGHVQNRYGSNEVGVVCEDVDVTGTGYLSAGVEVRIVGPDGAEVPPGQRGIVMVRTPSMAEGYIGLPELTAKSFRDGWFISGDAGALVGPRRLRLDGRHDDLLNLGGIKVPASEVEGDLRKLPAIAECAALAVLMDGGAVSLGLAIVLAPGATEEEAKLQMREGLARLAGARICLLFLRGLPAMQGGKVDRMALLRLFEAIPPANAPIPA